MTTSSTSVAAGSTARCPNVSAIRRRNGFGSTTTTSAPNCAGDGGDQQADRSTADHQHLLPGLHVGAANVVHGDRDGLHERRRPAAARSSGSRTRRSAGTVQRLLHRAGRVDPQEAQVAGRCAGCRPGRRRTRRTTATASRSPDHRPPSRPRPAPSTATRPDISCPSTAAPTHSGIHVAVEDVQVRAADPGVGDLDLHLARAGFADLTVLDLELPLAGVHGCSHGDPTGPLVVPGHPRCQTSTASDHCRPGAASGSRSWQGSVSAHQRRVGSSAAIRARSASRSSPWYSK